MITRDIKIKIENAIPGATAHVLDPMNDGQHLQAIVISPAFDGLSLIKQHQLVMAPLKDDFESYVHALGLKTFTPEKWDKVKDQYQI